MTEQPTNYRFPSDSDWRFDLVRRADEQRAGLLEAMGSPRELLRQICSAFRASRDRGELRFGKEQSPNDVADKRGVIQFHIGEHLFDWFFNARTGYRALFRVDEASGQAFNNQIISGLLSALREAKIAAIAGRLLDREFLDVGNCWLDADFLSKSFSVGNDLPKIWFCGRLILGDGGTKLLPWGLGPPRLIVGDGEWAAVHRDDVDCWLEIKGAYLGSAGPYQIKPPSVRAKRLKASGEA